MSIYRGSLFTKLTAIPTTIGSSTIGRNLLALELEDLKENIENILNTKQLGIGSDDLNEINSLLTYGAGAQVQQNQIEPALLIATIEDVLHKYEPRIINLQVAVKNHQANDILKVNGMIHWEDHLQQIYFEIYLDFAIKHISIIGF